mmetsp:Transcript_292/g.543  ORF Transcript_292/g.543 Transcript_292/m.543 type:complete len:90 (-) Transcript_292:373-642(-)
MCVTTKTSHRLSITDNKTIFDGNGSGSSDTIFGILSRLEGNDTAKRHVGDGCGLALRGRRKRGTQAATTLVKRTLRTRQISTQARSHLK